MYCKHCNEKILKSERVYRADDGFVHEECIEDYIDEQWDELNLVEKLRMFDFSTSCTEYGDTVAGDMEDMKRDRYYDERMAV